MIVAMPTGSSHGWGIAGTYLTQEIYRLPVVEGVALHCMRNPDFAPSSPDSWERHNIGYCFFEHDIEAYAYTEQAAQRYDHIVAGSSWCEHHLRIGGVKEASTILQGIDHTLFYPAAARDDDGRFIVFSGGKFELRKGQDVVIAAIKVMMERHRDVWLACSWHNIWPFSIATMVDSPLIAFSMGQMSCDQLIARALQQNGVDLERVIVHPLTPNSGMRQVYALSDVGLFPNRCEGGNNMVMCEYMACGRGVIASSWTGHADVIDEQNSLPLEHFSARLVWKADKPVAVWFDPELEEVIERLEYAYQHRDVVKQTGYNAAHSMQQLDWQQAARSFQALAVKYGVPASEPTPFTLLRRATRLTELQDLNGALYQLQQALQLSPLNADIYKALGLVYEAMGKTQESIFCNQKSQALESRQQTKG